MEFPWVYSISAIVVAYFFGSIPSSVWWGKAFYGVDVREHGSRNAGATNTFRVLGWRAGVPVLVIDILKGFIPVRLLPNFSDLEPDTAPWMWLRVALLFAAVLGHLYPIMAKFRGGKGMATSLGGVLAVHPGAALICLIVFLVVFLLSKYVSLGSLGAAITFPIAVALIYHEASAVKVGFAIILCLLVFFTHRENIARLLRGEENKMSFARKNSEDR
ncbi:MAG: glycerol-3-phosphate 1-O-acyltransferase PlsY [Flavobacteriales bacterium]|nr:glycerol-3-phosphate 1-O-acyltransferase PlsY [Flavobacteriales bacterium]MBK7239214.1 glycerol-3-phosphate 1-O-acyltransferase PlsY [Flavobacteriales bacterium]MBK7298517.1 glycerol-3-phosphate 1-O-acyltransferase PlsY [Flavobacteriales bacterium]MBK9536680.1 glycerol-3-phosphate 1-O-acyltransferase PlsY [Flavobacteriales bacterium]MBP9139168.1 glycerol-3-phosphate 1-O-acyltransferase PlsY [Flavobacteriales bacterium]